MQVREQTAEQVAPSIDLKIVADYVQKHYEAVKVAKPNTKQGEAAFSTAIHKLEQTNERIPTEHPQLKALLTHAAQSPDLPTLKNRMEALNTNFIQRHTTPQPSIQQQLAESKQQLAEQKSNKARTTNINKNTGLGD